MMNTYPPRVFAKMVGRTVLTLQRWDKAGKLIAHRTSTGRRYYTHEQYLEVMNRPALETTKQVVAYCRVSSSSQKKDLASQRAAVEQFCMASGREIGEVLDDVGSGLNYTRKNFLRLMERVESNQVSEIVIAHKDRLVRFGYEWFEHFCRSHDCAIVVMNAQTLSPEKELTQDLLSILHVFSSRLYGLRKYKRKIITLVTAEDEACHG